MSVTLIRPGRPSLSDTLAELWSMRETLYILTWRDIKVRYKQTVLGAAWSILQPVLMMAVFALFLGLLAKVPSNGVPYPLLVFTGLVPWTFFVYALIQGGNSLVANEQLLTKAYFPRLFIPTSAVLAGLIDLGLSALTLGVIMALYGQAPSVALLAAPVVVLFAIALGLGVALLLSALTVTYRDVRYTVTFLSQLLFYLSPIAYPSTIVPSGYRVLYGLDPMAGIVEACRWMLLGRSANWGMMGVSAAVILVLLTVGWRYFRRVERSFADVV